MKKNHQPIIFVFSGPGGAGKTTLVNRLFRKKFVRDNFIRGISYTTRRRRPQEKGGHDYFFVSKSEFLRLKSKNFFLENEKVLENYYGTPKFFFTRAQKAKKDLILCIDVKGGMYLKKTLKQGKIVTIFISAPTRRDLLCRLGVRAEQKDIIQRRIRLAKEELCFAPRYDYLVINQDIKNTLTVLAAVLLAEKFRR